MNKSIKEVSQKLNISEEQIKIVLDLLQEGSTVPFIARYRKHLTGGLNEEEIEVINKSYTYTLELNKRKEAILEILKEDGVLTDKIKKQINNAQKKSELESIYAPFKDGKKTKASQAIKLGLEPLAKTIFTSTDESFNPFAEAKKYLSNEVENTDFAIEQASLIIAQWISQDIDERKNIKEYIFHTGFICSEKKKNVEDPKEKFKNYYSFKEQINKIPAHRILALIRGEKLKILSIKLEYMTQKITYDLNEKYFKIPTTGKIIYNAIQDALKRLILPSIKREIKSDLFASAEEKSIELFANNLEQLLLSPMVKNKTILAIDPAFASGCKVAVLSKKGDVLNISLIKPTPPFNQIEKSEQTINELIDKYDVDIIVIGNGTASRETEAFVAKLIKKRDKIVPFAIVSEVGASVYSASKIAIKEFPKLSVEQRSAIHIGRKFQDPLNELVKIDPKSIGIGQYQHDVNQKELSNKLTFKVNKVVNLIGVDINTATEEILTYISGLTPKIAKNILEYRKANESFKNRKELKNVDGLGPKAFEQSVGFLRILDSDVFFDKTQIHPESYELAQKIVDELHIDLKNIDKAVVEKADIKSLVAKFDSNEYEIKLILESLIAPEKDIRDENDGPVLKEDILDIKDIKKGNILEGSVQNITDFGVFIYIGIKQAALVHISNLSDSFVRHPSEVVKTGQKVSIEIIDVDIDRSRIQAKLLK